MRITFRINNTIQVFKYGTTSNAKIAKQRYWVSLKDKDKHIEKGTVKTESLKKIVQTYTYSINQLQYVINQLKNGSKLNFNDFFGLDSENCFDCPFSISNGNGGCYTHSYTQYSGFLSMLKSIANEFNFDINKIPTFDNEIAEKITKVSKNKYIRFGTYGEPSMHPVKLVEKLCTVASLWTGYSHQYFRKPEYNNFFMASVHNEKQAQTAKNKFNFRSFVAIKENNGINAIQCPASKEGGFKTTCADCGLCSGILGKGKKSVVILEH